jgi:cardiolipin synthase
MGAAITNRRVLGPAEANTMAWLGVALLLFAAVSVLWPLVVALPLAVLSVWVAMSSLARARDLRAARGQEGGEESKAAPQPQKPPGK